MKLAFILLAFLSIGLASSGPISKEQLSGVWGIVAMGNSEKKDVVILDNDSAIISVFPGHKFSTVGHLINSAKDPEVRMAYTVLGMFSNMFIQFDAKNNYGEGMKPETPEQKPAVKRGIYSLDEERLAVSTGGRAEMSGLAYKSGYLVMSTETGSVMYLRKFRDTLY
jgi:hypothetical protein